MTDLEGPLTLLHLHRGFYPPEKRDRQGGRRARKRRCSGRWRCWRRSWPDSAYLLGDRFTVADLNVAGVLSASRIAVIDMSPFPHDRRLGQALP